MEIQFRNIQQPLLNRYANARENLVKNMNDRIKDLRVQIQNQKTILENASPDTILKRGYSMVTDSSGKIIRSASQVIAGNEIVIKPAEGKISAIVK